MNKSALTWYLLDVAKQGAYVIAWRGSKALLETAIQLYNVHTYRLMVISNTLGHLNRSKWSLFKSACESAVKILFPKASIAINATLCAKEFCQHIYPIKYGTRTSEEEKDGFVVIDHISPPSPKQNKSPCSATINNSFSSI